MKILIVLLLAFLSVGHINYEFTPGELNNDRMIIDLLNEDYIIFRGDEELIFDIDLEIGDMITFEVYPSANVKGYQFVIVFDGQDEELNYQYARFFSDIDGNWTYYQFDLVITSTSITFENSIFVIEDESLFWTSRELPTIYNIPTYLRSLIIYRIDE